MKQSFGGTYAPAPKKRTQTHAPRFAEIVHRISQLQEGWTIHNPPYYFAEIVVPRGLELHSKSLCLLGNVPSYWWRRAGILAALFKRERVAQLEQLSNPDQDLKEK